MGRRRKTKQREHCRSELAREKPEGAAGCQVASVIVDDLREQARSYRGQHFRALSTASMKTVGDASCISRLRSEEHTSELQSLMRISYAVFCLKKKKQYT